VGRLDRGRSRDPRLEDLLVEGPSHLGFDVSGRVVVAGTGQDQAGRLIALFSSFWTTSPVTIWSLPRPAGAIRLGFGRHQDLLREVQRVGYEKRSRRVRVEDDEVVVTLEVDQCATQPPLGSEMVISYSTTSAGINLRSGVSIDFTASAEGSSPMDNSGGGRADRTRGVTRHYAVRPTQTSSMRGSGMISRGDTGVSSGGGSRGGNPFHG
jgi:hypothetical protein